MEDKLTRFDIQREQSTVLERIKSGEYQKDLIKAANIIIKPIKNKQLKKDMLKAACREFRALNKLCME